MHGGSDPLPSSPPRPSGLISKNFLHVALSHCNHIMYPHWPRALEKVTVTHSFLQHSGTVSNFAPWLPRMGMGKGELQLKNIFFSFKKTITLAIKVTK